MSLVIEALRWILVGLGLGVALEMFRHVSAFRRLVDLPDWQSRAQELEFENRSLTAQLSILPKLQESLAQAHTESRSAQTAPDAVVVHQVDEPVLLGLEDLPGLPAEVRARLIALGITTPSQLAELDSDELRTKLDLMPWDTADPEAWMTAAATLNKAPQPEPSRPRSAETAHFDQLPGINPHQAALLKSRFEGFADLAGSDESAILNAIDAMPWDLVPVSEWKDYARSKT